jgi:predicted CxxxxCH...CXXCH cytochrome family protein
MVTRAPALALPTESRPEVNPMTRTRSSRSPRAALAAACAATLLLASACGRGGSPSQPAKAGSPHEALSSGASCAGVDVHTKHLNLFACVHCHPTGATFGFDVPYAFAGGTTTAGGTVERIPGQPTSCTVACHFPKGPPKRVDWNTPGPLACTGCHAPTALPQAHPPVAADATRADCETCHVTSAHMEGAVALVGHEPAFKTDPASPQFHAARANDGLADCQGCHGQDLAGGAARASCARCHDEDLPDGVASWKVNCVMCHGGTDGASGAPPTATWGNDADAVRVGAHTAHVTPSAVSPGFDCSVCHVKPADALAGGHLDAGPAEVRFAGVGAVGVPAPPTWDREAATCAGTYCHGATMKGGTKPTPVWTRTGEAACGACHGLPPPAPHATAAGLAACASCHAATMNATGALIAPSAGGKHLDGTVQATGGHPAGWMDAASAGFHAVSANQDLSGCGSCHGPNLDGVGGSATTSCATAGCHGPTWRTNCLMCHGGLDNSTGAPPTAIWGHEAEARRVGAHTKHLGATLSPAVACAECHPVPADALTPGHVDGSAVKIAFGPRATSGGAAPTYDAAAGRCSATYCHGNYSGTYVYTVWDWGADMPVEMQASYAGNRAAPAFTDGPMTCGSCHGNPPTPSQSWHSGFHGNRPEQRECQLCHPDAFSVNGVATGITDPTRHIDGIVDVAASYDGTCFGCH